MLEIINHTKQRINKNKISDTVELFLDTYKKTDFLVTLVLTGDQKIRTLNRRYRRLDKVTDILSIRQEEYMGNILGEIIINLKEVGRKHKYQDLLRELKSDKLVKNKQANFIFYFLLVHGLLHLSGYNDDSVSERREMISLGKNFMKKITKYGIIKL
ncbi:MAG: rRNA maturation RNase YbeY [Candidatus Falkowbacteria bacterium]|nr:rRNA maturation RNase YbeY [Candidatus Falkowbacteria bacterium]